MLAILRFDASKNQGLGHLVRSLALADAAIASGWQIEVCGDIDNPAGLKMIGTRGYTIRPAPRHPADLADLAVCRKADIVHVDTYAEQGNLRDALGSAGILLSSMEDGSNGRRAADLVVDPSPGSELSLRPFDGSMRLYRGRKAIPLRQSILGLAHAPQAAFEGRVRRIMIIMGGTDASDLTMFMLECWLETGLGAECNVVADPETVASWDPELVQDVLVHSPGPNIPELFPEMDLVITASGTTIWELAYLGTAMAILQVVENQRENYLYATSNGMSVGLGTFVEGQLDRQTIVRMLVEAGSSGSVRDARAQRARSLIDGSGSRNIVEQWSLLVKSVDGPVARIATIDDASTLFEWRNDASVRDVSRNTGELSWAGHVAWLEGVLNNPTRLLFIVEDNLAPIGTVRFDAQTPEDGRWEVSITVSPHVRGRGMGKVVLSAGEKSMFSTHPDARLFAEMLETNVASYRLFKAAGYSGSMKVVEGLPWHSLDKRMP
ncbi:GNAT family N-acetyltransferase [Specibacter sp. NPDC078709]|uniref:GNAT family N-acetyltransferase n=1 Tax=Specibacter sp. NPDC078709 TaxID=3154364 RepID=UPI003442A649